MTYGTKLDRAEKLWIEKTSVGNAVLYPRNSNVSIGQANEKCIITTQAYPGQIGYSTSGSTIGNGNKFLSIFSIESIVGDANISCSLFGQTQTIGDANIYLSIFGGSNTILDSNYKVMVAGESNSIGNSNQNISLFGQSNTVGSSCGVLFIEGQSNVIGDAVYLTSILGNENIVGAASNYNVVIGKSNFINTSSTHNFIIGENNKLDSSHTYNFIFGNGNDFTTSDVDAIEYNHILANTCVFNAESIQGTFQYNFITGRNHSFLNPDIQENFIAGNSHLITGGTQAKYNAIFGYQNYVYGDGGPAPGNLSLVTGKFAKSSRYACHVNSGGHPSLATISIDDMDEDCGGGQNIGMIPHSGLTQSTGFRPIYMNGAINGELYTIEENKATLLITYVVASADAGERTRGWKIETLVNRPLGGSATIVSSTVTPLGTTSLGGESVWDVKNTVSGGNIFLEVNAGSAMPVMWQAYGLGPEVISTENYVS